MKKWTKALFVLALALFVLAGCQKGEEESKKETSAESQLAQATQAKDGTYQGKTSGMQGPLVAEITVEEGKITAIAFPENDETPTVTKVAFQRIPAQIIAHQSLKMDTVTGATISSNAILRAVEEAAKEAGLDVAKMKATEVNIPRGEAETLDTDVLVIGGGGAGFSAAITAAQNGSKVILIEKGSILGGNTLLAGDAINANDPGAQSIMILSPSQKEALDGYLALDPKDPALQLDRFPEWEEVLTKLQGEIKAYYAANEGKEAGKDLPGFDSVTLHQWHMYAGGLREFSNGQWIAPNLEMARTLTDNVYQSMEWMDQIGMQVSYGETADSGRGGTSKKGLYTVLGAMWPRTHLFVAGQERIDVLEKAATEQGVQIFTETRGTELLTDGGKVVGAKAVRADGTPMTFHTTKGVILASGGYSANPAMVKEYDAYWGDALTDHTLTTNLGTNEGDGILMAQKIGADTVGMEIAQLMPSSSPTKGTMTDGIWGDAGEQIWIGADGKRFVNEYAERDVLAKASLEQPDGIFYILYGGRALGEGQALQGATMEDGIFGNTVEKMVKTGNVWYGETLAELAEATKKPAAGVAPAFTEDQLRETIEQYNAYVDAQHDDAFGKEVLTGKIDLDAIDKNEGYGLVLSPRKASLHHTMGGLKINTKTEVLNKDGQVIPGLWAAGEVTGGVHGGNRLGGNAIADIFTFGRIAGQEASEAK